ncbi:MAG: M23 family metallopeptidase [Lachnospiraceae bacterium]|jgi:murein DD-endopeptidase MepM/ murein hydrolase activator NlpD|nr:M23 family metallopeptidase [Lachnospiraceae bacterium]
MQKKWWVFGSFFLFVLLFFLFEIGKKEKVITVDRAVEQDYIKWVDFKVTCEAMKEAYEYDVQSWNEEVHLPWIELLAYLGAKYGGDFSHYKQKDMEEIVQKLREGEVTIQELKKEMKYFSYYLEAYGAVLGGMVGEYEIEREEEGEKKWEKIYGLKAFSPIPKGFPYSDYDDFGVSRSYGYKRTHLGHDVMGQIGTPIVAVESGYVEALGWNQYGGWRIGIRSFDKKRYYYYAHLRQNYPYAENLKEGDIVIGGDIIGYMGHTGYSKKENVNNIDQVHLHWGLQLIFHESQKEGSNEIWISCYELMKFLRQNQVEAKKVEGTKEWKRTFEMKDLNVAHP